MDIKQYVTPRSIIALFIVTLLGISIIFIFIPIVNRSGKQPVSIYVAPKDAAVSVDGVRTSGSPIYLEPGAHRVTIAKDGFRQSVTLLTVKESSSEQIVAVGLDPISDDAKRWYSTHTDEYLVIESVIGKQATQEGNDFRTKNPIINNLPYSTMLYTIGYKNDLSDTSGSSIILTVSAPAVYRNAAINQISNWGYNPVDYKIVINNERNPFTP